MSRTLSAGFLRATLVILIALSEGPTVRASLAKRVSGHLVFWDQTRGFDAIVANHDVFSEISPFWYRVGAEGDVVPYTTGSGASYEDPAILSFLRSRGILILPTVANILDGVWNGPLVSRILADPVLSAANISNLVDLAVTHGYDGIDLDYENLSASDRTAFTSFVNRLAAALHAQGKLLTVNVYAKTAEPGTWDGPRAQDWWAIGRAADQVRIMAYEYHWSSSGPGPISPIGWVRDVLAFARSAIPARKIMHGVPLYGYDWVGRSGVDHVWQETMASASRNAATINWDPASAAPWFAYLAGRTQHTVWFENAMSTDAKLQLTTAYGVGGITLWRLGGEDPETWSRIRAHLGGTGGTGGTGDAVPPAVAIVSPLEGAWLQKQQRIEALATDNVGVARVEISVNGALLSSDTTPPYVAYWNTRRAAAGSYVIKAVAYDASGNSAASTVTTYR